MAYLLIEVYGIIHDGAINIPNTQKYVKNLEI